MPTLYDIYDKAKNIRKTGSTYQTNDYDLFTRLEGNRAVLTSRVKKIIRSIEKYGYIYNPIVVNEKFEVIDGQGRLEALRYLDIPVDFVVVRGAGIEECIALNASGTIWKTTDYIDSFCEQGNENYIRFKTTLENYPGFAFSVKGALALGITGLPSETIKDGRLTFSVEKKKEAEEILNFVSLFISRIKTIKGRNEFYYFAIAFAYQQPDIDNKRLIDVIQRTDFPPAADIRCALDNLSDVYNKNLSVSKKRYLFPIYEQTMSEQYPWYDVIHVSGRKEN